jgi:hypothetical protein
MNILSACTLEVCIGSDVYNPTIGCLKSDPKLSNPNPIRALIKNFDPIR